MCRINELKKITNMSDKHASTWYTDIQEIQGVNNTRLVYEVQENMDYVQSRGNRRRVYDNRRDFSSNCEYCGGIHKPGKCPAYGRRCGHCNKFKHYEK